MTNNQWYTNLKIGDVQKWEDEKQKNTPDERLIKSPCLSREHNPPNMLYVPPGSRFKHVCPVCGNTTIIYGGGGNLLMGNHECSGREWIALE